MMMIVDTSGSDKKFGEIRGGLEELGDSMGLMIRAQKEEIFNMMHRI